MSYFWNNKSSRASKIKSDSSARVEGKMERDAAEKQNRKEKPKRENDDKRYDARRVEDREEILAKESKEEQRKNAREEQFRKELDEARRNIEITDKAMDEQREAEERQRRMDEEQRRQDRKREDIKKYSRNDIDLRCRMHQLLIDQKAASSTIMACGAAAAAEGASQTGRMIQEIATESEAQKQFNLRNDQRQKEMEMATLEERNKTSQFIKTRDDSMQATILKMEKKKERDLENIRKREKEIEDRRVQYAKEWKSETEKEEKRVREKTRQFAESSERMKRDKETDTARYYEDLDRSREAHSAKVEEILKEERRRMEEINRKKTEKEEERRMQWSRMMHRFAEFMKVSYNGSINNEMEKKWDDRFNKLRRSYDPVKESYFELESIPFRNDDIATAVLQFEAHLESLQMSLLTVEEIISTEQRQVEKWKPQQPNAYFLIDLGTALETILLNVARVRREIETVVNEVDRNRENTESLKQVFQLQYLEHAITELTYAVDSIPTVYQLNKKYATTM